MVLNRLFFSFLMAIIYLSIPSFSFAASGPEGECRSVIERAVNRAAPNSIEMMRAGEKARDECFNRFYNQNSTSNKFPSYEQMQAEARHKIAEEKNKIFGEKSVGEALGTMFVYVLLGALVVVIPVIGIVAGPLLMGYGVVVFLYTVTRLHFILIGFIVLVVGVALWRLLRNDGTTGSYIEPVEASRDDLLQKRERDEEFFKQIRAEEEQCLESLEKMSNDEYKKASHDLIMKAIADSSRVSWICAETIYLGALLNKGFNDESTTEMISVVTQSLHIKALRVFEKNNVNFNHYDLNKYKEIAIQNKVNGTAKRKYPIKKKALDVLGIIIKNLNTDNRQKLYASLKKALKDELAEDFEYIDKLFAKYQ